MMPSVAVLEIVHESESVSKEMAIYSLTQPCLKAKTWTGPCEVVCREMEFQRAESSLDPLRYLEQVRILAAAITLPEVHLLAQQSMDDKTRKNSIFLTDPSKLQVTAVDANL